LVEHPPVLTLGRRAQRSDILWNEAELAERGLAVHDTPRGGQVTLHAPGQLVVYPVVHVGRRIRGHLMDLAEVTIALTGELGVHDARYREDQPGVWVGESKLASIGVHIRGGVAIQGLALNLSVDPTFFGALVSCGLREIEVVSVRDVGGASVDVEVAARRWAELYAARLGRSLRWDVP
jgi:lipoate-protein ligase B